MDLNERRHDERERLDTVRKSLKNADELEYKMPMNEDFFDRLHDKIMAEVEKTEIAPAPSPLVIHSRNMLRAHWRSWLYPAAGITSLLLIAGLLVPQLSGVSESMQRAGLYSDGHERIIERALLNPEELSQTFITSQSEADFFMDVASESFENLSVAKFNKIMGESTR